nr:Gag-Pol polyprotein [Tanacetum cinerariifolium]
MVLGYQNPFYLKQAQKKQQSLYDGKVLLEKHDPLVVHDSEETLQLAQESRDKMKQMNKEIKPANYTKINHLSGELHKIVREEIFPIVNQVDARVQNFEIQFLKEAAKFVGEFKSLANEADASLAKHKTLELEIERLLKAVVTMDDDYIGGQPSATVETVPPAQEPQVCQSSTASTTIVETAPTPTNSSSHAINFPITSPDVDELNSNAMVDGNTFVNPFANSSTSANASSSSQNVDPSNMHTFYQPYPHELQWTKDHPLEQVIGEPP